MYRESFSTKEGGHSGLCEPSSLCPEKQFRMSPFRCFMGGLRTGTCYFSS